MLPLNRLRKGVVFLFLLLFLFIFYRLFFFRTKADPILPEDDPLTISTEMCLLVTSNGPMNIDTVFNLQNNITKIFAYSSLGTGFYITDTMWHEWYHGSDIIKKVICKQERAACHSSISSDSLQEGGWSVDTRQNGILLNVKQFTVLQPK
uniref:Uncharacterized protein n=1 Tax=uncultured bacterium contig00069 TaxID=1181550 RepID=A0A806KDQ2_9BACT|nr:hypothetical protein [uncultured bacterium contig00069]